MIRCRKRQNNKKTMKYMFLIKTYVLHGLLRYLPIIRIPTGYGEFAPYHFINEEEEFISGVKALRP